jgi:hypothetical protein
MAEGLPVASIGVSASIPSQDQPNHEDSDAARHERVAAVLQAAFMRLAPQGSDRWNFLAAFTHLGDRYGPYKPGASALSELLQPDSRQPGHDAGWRGRLARTRTSRPDETSSELEEAMGHVVEAFRFLSARVQTLEERLAREDQPVDGAAWLAPAQELDELIAPITAHLLEHRGPQGTMVHGDCGSGGLLVALGAAGVRAEGVEPRGAVALDALDKGCDVVICEVLEDVAARPDASLHGLVLSGVVDRLPLHALIALVNHSRRALALGAPLVLVVSDPGEALSRDRSSRDLVPGRPLGTETWELLLERAGFVEIEPMPTAEGHDGRRIITASVPS